MSTSYTEMNTLAACEQKWAFKYVERLPDPSGPKAQLGTLIHELTALFWRGEPWRPVLMAEEASDNVQTAWWLMERYEEHYDKARDKIVVEATELDISSNLWGFPIRGKVDQLWRVGDRLWLRECKTMGDWSRLDYLTVDPQLTIYYALVQEHFPELFGIMFDAIRTYRWKRDEHPTSDSFQLIQLDRGPDQVAAAKRIAAASVVRMDQLRADCSPIPHISRDCSWCPYKLECFDRLAFPEPEIEVVD